MSRTHGQQANNTKCWRAEEDEPVPGVPGVHHARGWRDTCPARPLSVGSRISMRARGTAVALIHLTTIQGHFSSLLDTSRTALLFALTLHQGIRNLTVMDVVHVLEARNEAKDRSSKPTNASGPPTKLGSATSKNSLAVEWPWSLNVVWYSAEFPSPSTVYCTTQRDAAARGAGC